MHTLATGRAWQPLKYTVRQRPYAWDRERGALLLVCDGPAAWRDAQEGWVLPRGRPVPLSLTPDVSICSTHSESATSLLPSAFMKGPTSSC